MAIENPQPAGLLLHCAAPAQQSSNIFELAAAEFHRLGTFVHHDDPIEDEAPAIFAAVDFPRQHHRVALAALERAPTLASFDGAGFKAFSKWNLI